MTANSKIANAVYIEFVRLLYTARWPIVVVGCAMLTTGLAVAWQTHDLMMAVIGLAGMAVTLGRLVLCFAFDHAVAKRPLDVGMAKLWERRLAVGVISTGVCVGAFAVRCFLLPDLAAHMIAGGLVFGYCAGTTTRFSIRPWIVQTSLVVSVTPAVAAALWNLDLLHTAQALLFVIFALGGLELIDYIHATTAEQLTLRAEATRLARADALTNLPNRRHLVEHFNELAKRLTRHGEGFAVISLDLDFFKEANDRFGHAAGDEILRIVAGRMTELLDDEDLAARIGGDEFVVVQANVTDTAAADDLGRRIVAALSEPYAVAGEAVLLGASFGRALAPSDGVTLDELLHKADEALYAVKRNRPGRVREVAFLADHAPLVTEIAPLLEHDQAAPATRPTNVDAC
ncbi:GGDEF domain-containing protein [Rhodopseudomonas sp. BR0M22]|uniref:GGDEF domain-containing protein n=1 Tax=Rhodopseudomonas sp. BR0M22 TaxID=2269369 RepID=UPI0013DF65E3|nr:GGDEF domain-containing protein [Rhodopseudomonas sp. BR0M22]NEW93486.1 GGDEF domain-containing protein [Rhodopseudomonas sp. BR0M22]